jgi:hypothetical protein
LNDGRKDNFYSALQDALKAKKWENSFKSEEEVAREK